jgi:hypothetical protein
MSLNILGSCIRKKATHTPNIATILVRELYSANICEYSAPGSCIRNCSPNIATPGSYIRRYSPNIALVLNDELYSEYVLLFLEYNSPVFILINKIHLNSLYTPQKKRSVHNSSKMKLNQNPIVGA